MKERWEHGNYLHNQMLPLSNNNEIKIKKGTRRGKVGYGSVKPNLDKGWGPSIVGSQ